ncbi:MAG: U32 family peptidase [Selenomonadaceae bacterium]|nr:U32 family peptidase [Selenomonadaceae bacterium]
MEKVELLAPAGNLEKLKAAIIYGADAVYLGGKDFSLRALGKNFSDEELKEGIEFVHSYGKKAYVTLNIYPHNDDMKRLPNFVRFLANVGVDAVLVSDLGIFMMVREIAPELSIHISTQANVTNYAAVAAWEKLGAKRVVLARELSKDEISDIRKRTPLPLEIFVHGAMCVSYSGRCLISAYLTGRDSNRGNCAQSCRWNYELIEKNRPDESFPVAEDERGTYFFNSKDLCLLPYIKDAIETGVASLKIEGRMKSVNYVATVVRAYRLAIDAYYKDKENFFIREEWLQEVEKVSHRPYWSGFFFGDGKIGGQVYGTSSYEQGADFLGVLLSYDKTSKRATIEQRGCLTEGEKIEILQPKGEVLSVAVRDLRNDEGEKIERTPHPKEIFSFALDKNAKKFSIIRRVNK